MHRLTNRLARLRAQSAEAGMTTTEYAVGTLATAAFAGVLFKVLSGPKVQAALGALIDKALN